MAQPKPKANKKQTKMPFLPFPWPLHTPLFSLWSPSPSGLRCRAIPPVVTCRHLVVELARVSNILYSFLFFLVKITEGDLAHTKHFFSKFRYDWQVTFCKFNMHNMLSWYIYTLQYDCHCSKHLFRSALGATGNVKMDQHAHTPPSIRWRHLGSWQLMITWHPFNLF